MLPIRHASFSKQRCYVHIYTAQLIRPLFCDRLDLHINENVGIVTQSAMPIFEDKMPLNNKLVGILILTSVVTCLNRSHPKVPAQSKIL